MNDIIVQVTFLLHYFIQYIFITGYLMSAIFKSINTASLLSVPIDFLTLIFSGLFLQLG
jgi:hypothetical protein